LRFDLAVTSYILAPVALFAFLPRIGFPSSTFHRRITTIYLIIMAAVAFLMELIDFEFFGQFNTRLNHLLIEWMDTPVMVLKMIWEMFSVIPALLAWLGLTVLFGVTLRWITRKIYDRPQIELSIMQFAVIYPLVLGLVFLGIRGRVAIKAPLTWGVACFSPYNFANQLALNSCFTFVQDALVETSRRNRDAAPFADVSVEEAYSKVRELLEIKDDQTIKEHPIAKYEGVGTFADSQEVRQSHNVILILMESFASEYISSTAGSRSLAPEFDKMTEDGLLFTRFYTSSGHTFSGIFSSICGLPVLPGRSLMKKAEGQQQLSGLATLLKRRGYNTLFYVPHDLHFDNMQGFLVVNSFDRLTGQEAYPSSEVLSSLGVPDEVMFDRVLVDLSEVQEPFLTMIMTASNHGPFFVPDRPHPHPDPSEPQYKRFNAFTYADWALGRFYRELQQTEWGKRTLLVILGDSGIITDLSSELDLALFHTPLLLINPELIQPGISNKIGGQKDIVATVMDALNGKWVNNTLGSSLLDDKPGHALFIEGQAVGFMQDENLFIKGRDGNKCLFRSDDLVTEIHDDELTNEMSDYSRALLTTTYHLIKSRLAGLP